MNKAVYTVITDHQKYKLREPLIDNPNWDHICFSTNPTHSNKWDVIDIKDTNCLGVKKLSRYWKIRGLTLMPEYDIILYLDSRFTLKVNLDQYFEDFIKSKKVLGVMKHNKRDCAYDELTVLAQLDIEKHSVVIAQEMKYYSWGMPKHFGLWAPGIMIRKKNVFLEHMMEIWWDDVSKFSYRDIPSLSWAMWKKESLFNMDMLYEYNFNKTYEDFMGRS